MKKLVLSIFVLVILSYCVSAAVTLDCPSEIDKDYEFTYTSSAKKVKLQIGYDENFARKTYTKIKSKTSPIPINDIWEDIMEYFRSNPNGKIYAQAHARERGGKKYSEVCEFTLANVQILDPEDWLENPELSISQGMGYNGGSALEVPCDAVGGNEYVWTSARNAELFGDAWPFDLTNAVLTADVRVVEGYRNYMQIHVEDDYWHISFGAPVYHKGNRPGWERLKLDLSYSYYPDDITRLMIKLGPVTERCQDSVYIDNFMIEKDGKIAIWNFE